MYACMYVYICIYVLRFLAIKVAPDDIFKKIYENMHNIHIYLYINASTYMYIFIYVCIHMCI
jgi:hypothetical protein